MTTLSYPTEPGDIDHRLVDDHDLIRALFEHLEAHRGDRRALADQVVFFLSVHTAAEEATLYPSLASCGDEELADLARESHQQMKTLAASVQRGRVGTRKFDRALADLMSEVRQHATEEESWLGRLREKLGDGAMADLGDRFGAAKLTAPTRPHALIPSKGPLNRMTGTLAGAADRARDLVSNRQQRIGSDASGLLDPQAQLVADAYGRLNLLPLDALSPAMARRQPTIADALTSALGGRRLTSHGTTVVVEERQVPRTHEHPPITVRLYREDDLTGDDEPALPVVVYAHGGGGVLGDIDAFDSSARALAAQVPCVVASIDYRRAPEDPFPAGHQDVLAAAMWILRQGDALGINPHRYAVCGEDIGANMIAAAAMDLAALDFAKPALAVLITPLASAAQNGASFSEHADAQPYTRPAVSWLLHQLFAGSPKNARDLRFELLARTPEDLRRLPPTVVVTAERDVLRDQGHELARSLEAAGVDATPLHYLGMAHDFFGTGAVVEHAAQAQTEIAGRLRSAFGLPSAPG